MKKNLGVIIAFIAIILTTLVVVYAWLVDIKKTPKIIFKSGKVVYALEGSAVTGLVVPGQNLIDNPYTLTNQSTIDSQLRFKLVITLNNEVINQADDRVAVTLLLGTDFILNTEDNYYYYQDVTGVVSKTLTTPITILTSIVLDGAYVKNAYADKQVSITFVFEAKQADHVSWETLGSESIDFKTGE